jgi:hypothetical protein
MSRIKRIQTKFPADIQSAKDLKKWIESWDGGSVRINSKFRTYEAYHFQDYRGRIHYLYADGASTGSCKPENLNRALNVFICAYEGHEDYDRVMKYNQENGIKLNDL